MIGSLVSALRPKMIEIEVDVDDLLIFDGSSIVIHLRLSALIATVHCIPFTERKTMIDASISAEWTCCVRYKSPVL